MRTREAGPEVRQIEAGDTPIHSQSQVCSCGSGVMEKEREEGNMKNSESFQVMTQRQVRLVINQNGKAGQCHTFKHNYGDILI